MRYERILLIDDDPDDHEIFISALEKVSEQVSCAAHSDARAALQQLKQQKIAADVIFLDLNMPVMNGVEFLSEIKKIDRLKDIPVIVYSTSSHPETQHKVRALGADSFVTKPDRFDELVQILET